MPCHSFRKLFALSLSRTSSLARDERERNRKCKFISNRRLFDPIRCELSVWAAWCRTLCAESNFSSGYRCMIDKYWASFHPIDNSIARFCSAIATWPFVVDIILHRYVVNELWNGINCRCFYGGYAMWTDRNRMKKKKRLRIKTIKNVIRIIEFVSLFLVRCSNLLLTLWRWNT